ncbi:putative protein N(5)-glutamine methyltransferase [Nocardioides sp. Leaf285]|uniref:putative protein N(5)-glutamine methyltransferase n=1 Tax=Nocardioides sp. Leaf285 TaxID=1736322 RepID=UPI000A629155|nr:putative protein N(5)-glutamine methyltransferase [Nocardioides sp. Leaf285]
MDDPLVPRLRAAGCVYAEEEASLLRAAAEGSPDPGTLERMVAERVAGRPLEVVVGWAELAGTRVVVTPGVFVPRRRSAALVRAAEARLRPGATVVDLCCGTGAVGAALLARRPDLVVHAADLDPVAVACARLNLPAGPEGPRVHQGDLWAAVPERLRGAVDVAVANAPYVPTAALATLPPEARLHEPRAALDGGDDGLVLHRRLLAEAHRWLRPGGALVVEVGAGQVGTALALARGAGLRATVVRDDDVDGIAVVATLPRPATGLDQSGPQV